MKTAGVIIVSTLAVALVGCAPAPPVITPSVSASAANLLEPGAAERALTQLTAAAGTGQAIRVTVTANEATLTYLKDDTAATLDWNQGQVKPMDSDITNVGQAVFAVAAFNLGDVGRMFTQAATLTGSSANQVLQINEYNAGRVLMTVTTSPESQTIFFQPDATLINWLAFTTASGVTQALQSVAGDGAAVIAIGLTDQGFYADRRVDAATIERHTRPPKLPAYSALRAGTSPLLDFNPSLIDPAVLAGLLTNAPAAANKPDTAATFVIDRRNGLDAPLIRVSVGLTTLVYDLAGTDVTNTVP